MAFSSADLKDPTIARDMPSVNSKEQSDDVRGMVLHKSITEHTDTDTDCTSQSLATIL
jgi:hypothetical protein